MKKIRLTSVKFIKTYVNTTKDGKSTFNSHHYAIKYIEDGKDVEQERTGFVSDNQKNLLIEGNEIEIIEKTKTIDTTVFHNFEIATEAKAEKAKEQDWKENIVNKIKELEGRIEQLEKSEYRKQDIEQGNKELTEADQKTQAINAGEPEDDLPF
jgi:hypothetical protein